MLRIDIQSDSRSATLYCSGRIVFGMEIETLRSIALSRRGAQCSKSISQALRPSMRRDWDCWWNCSTGRPKVAVVLYFTNASEFVARLVALTRLYNVLGLLRPGTLRNGRGTDA